MENSIISKHTEKVNKILIVILWIQLTLTLITCLTVDKEGSKVGLAIITITDLGSTVLLLKRSNKDLIRNFELHPVK